MRVLGSAGKMEMEGVVGSALAGRESNGRRRREGQAVGSLRVAVLREKEQPKRKGWGEVAVDFKDGVGGDRGTGWERRG